MNLNPIKANMTELELNDGTRVLFSYKTPVAYATKNKNGDVSVFKTDKFWSKTTSRHINEWLPTYSKQVERQEWIERMANWVK